MFRSFNSKRSKNDIPKLLRKYHCHKLNNKLSINDNRFYSNGIHIYDLSRQAAEIWLKVNFSLNVLKNCFFFTK